MKDGFFEVGDKVTCVDVGWYMNHLDYTTEYTITSAGEINTSPFVTIKVDGPPLGSLRASRFKLVEEKVMCDWMFWGSWYGRGSKDIDTYCCTRCYTRFTALEGTDLPERECQ